MYRVLYILSRYGAKRKVFHRESIREERGLSIYVSDVNCDARVHGARVFVRVGVVIANRNKEGVYRVRERRVYTCIAFYIYTLQVRR